MCAPCASAMSTAMTAISKAAPTRSSFGGNLCLEDDAFRHALHRRQDRCLPQPVRHHGPDRPVLPVHRRHLLRHGGPHLHRQHQPRRAPCRSPAMRRCWAWAIISPPAAASITAPSVSVPPAPWAASFPIFDVAVDPDPGRFRQHHPHHGQSRLCAGQSGRHHRLLRLLCRRCAGPDRRADRDRGLPPQCRRHRHPRPQRHRRRTERQPRLWPSQSAGGPDLEDHATASPLFGGYSEANRAPTPLELDCASQTQPCLLEGSLVADPPLQQVVAHTYQAGLRGSIGWRMASWTGAPACSAPTATTTLSRWPA